MNNSGRHFLYHFYRAADRNGILFVVSSKALDQGIRCILNMFMFLQKCVLIHRIRQNRLVIYLGAVF